MHARDTFTGAYAVSLRLFYAIMQVVSIDMESNEVDQEIIVVDKMSDIDKKARNLTSTTSRIDFWIAIESIEGYQETTEDKHKAVGVNCGLQSHFADADKVQFEVEPHGNDNRPWGDLETAEVKHEAIDSVARRENDHGGAPV